MALVRCVILALTVLEGVCSHRSDPFAAEIEPADLNLQLHMDMSSVYYCNGKLFRRNGVIYSHKQALLGYQSGVDMNNTVRWYNDRIDCTFELTVGAGKWL